MNQVYLGHNHPSPAAANLLELQRSEYDLFLQKDIPADKRKDVGLHWVLKEMFGLAGTHDVFVEDVPDQKLLDELSDLLEEPSLDVKARILGNLPIKRMVKDVSPLKDFAKKTGIKMSFIPSGVRITEKKITVTYQYKDYKLKGPVGVKDDNQLFYLSQKADLKIPRASCKFKNLNYVYKLYGSFRVIVEKEGADPIIADDTIYLTDVPVMTKECEFIINGSPRSVISMLNRFVGVSFKEDKTKDFTNSGRRSFIATIDSDNVINHKTITFVISKDDVLYVMMGGRKILGLTFLRALGLTDDQINELYDPHTDVFPGLGKDSSNVFERSVISVAKEILKTSFVNTKTATPAVYSILLNFRLGKIGRLLTNKKLEAVYLDNIKQPQSDYLSIVDILMTIKYLLKLCSSREKGYIDDDTAGLDRRYVKSVRSLLEEVFLSGLDKVVKSTVAQTKNYLLKQ